MRNPNSVRWLPPVLAAGLIVSSAALSGPVASEAVVQSSRTQATKVLPDPATWSNRRLAAQLVMAGVTMHSSGQAKAWAREGIAGVVLFGDPPANLRARLQVLRANSPGQRLLIASDEEGGRVQRLRQLVGPMPSAAQIGRTRTPAQTRTLARFFGSRIKRLGVNSDLAPVADLLYPGSYTAGDGRAFKANPVLNARYVSAFAQGLRDARVSATVKHWPGGGSVANTHVGAGRTPAWTAMANRDLIPFRAAFAAGVDSVMVGHPRVPGLTGGLPASQSPAAFRALRQQAGPGTVIMTDSLAMAAVTSSLGQGQLRAAVRAIAAGSDIALVQEVDPLAVVAHLAAAIRTGQINRGKAVASARRILVAQQRWR